MTAVIDHPDEMKGAANRGGLHINTTIASIPIRIVKPTMAMRGQRLAMARLRAELEGDFDDGNRSLAVDGWTMRFCLNKLPRWKRPGAMAQV